MFVKLNNELCLLHTFNQRSQVKVRSGGGTSIERIFREGKDIGIEQRLTLAHQQVPLRVRCWLGCNPRTPSKRVEMNCFAPPPTILPSDAVFAALPSQAAGGCQNRTTSRARETNTATVPARICLGRAVAATQSK